MKSDTSHKLDWQIIPRKRLPRKLTIAAEMKSNQKRSTIFTQFIVVLE